MIKEIIESYGVRLRRVGDIYRGKCPFHNETHPSFTVYPKTESFYCFGCMRHGNAIKFIELIEGVDYEEAYRIFIERFNGKIEEKKSKKEDKREKIELPDMISISDPRVPKYFIDYIKRREIDKEILDKKYNVGVCLEGRYRDRLIFPIYMKGEIRSFIANDVTGFNKPKYLYPSTPKDYFFNFDNAIESNNIIVVEGIWDALRIGDNGLALLGSYITKRQLEVLREYSIDEVTIMLDADASKKIYILGHLLSFVAKRVYVALLDKGDPGEMSKKEIEKKIENRLEFSSDILERELILRSL